MKGICGSAGINLTSTFYKPYLFLHFNLPKLKQEVDSADFFCLQNKVKNKAK